MKGAGVRLVRGLIVATNSGYLSTGNSSRTRGVWFLTHRLLDEPVSPSEGGGQVFRVFGDLDAVSIQRISLARIGQAGCRTTEKLEALVEPALVWPQAFLEPNVPLGVDRGKCRDYGLSEADGVSVCPTASLS